MFNKRTRRNFRQRKGNSSEEEDEQRSHGDDEENLEKVPILVNKPLHPSQSRGISCNSKRESTPPKPHSSEEEEEEGEKLEVTEGIEERKRIKDGVKKKTNTALSFSDDKEGNYFVFKANGEWVETNEQKSVCDFQHQEIILGGIYGY